MCPPPTRRRLGRTGPLVASAEIPRDQCFADISDRHAYRDNTGSGWSTEEAYLVGDRTTDALLRDDLAKKPSASLLKWQEGEADIIGCVWLGPVGGSTWY